MKKMLSNALSCVLALSCLASSAAYAYADNSAADANIRKGYMNTGLAEALEGYTEIFSTTDDVCGTGSISYHVLYNGWDFAHVAYYDSDQFSVSIPASCEMYRDDIEDIIRSYIPDDIHLQVVYHATEQYMSFNFYDPHSQYGILKDLRNIFKDISEITEVIDCWYKDDKVTVRYSDYPVEPENFTVYYASDSERAAKIQDYVKENNLDFRVEVTEDTEHGGYNCHLIPNQDITLREHFAVDQQICKDLSLFNKKMAISVGKEYQPVSIDVLNSIDGDANEDGATNLADATAIIQAIGNPAKYALSAQGEFNADTDGNGLTGADALKIQRQLVEDGMPK